MLVGILWHFGYSNQPVFGKSPPSQINSTITVKLWNKSMSRVTNTLDKVLHFQTVPTSHSPISCKLKKKIHRVRDWNDPSLLGREVHSQTTVARIFREFRWCGGGKLHASKGYLSADIDQGPTMDSLLRDILHPHIDPSKMADSKPCHVVVRILWFLLDDRLQHSLQFVVPRINPPWFFGFTDSFLPRSVIEKKNLQSIADFWWPKSPKVTPTK